jgi:phosphohistidine phosphatase
MTICERGKSMFEQKPLLLVMRHAKSDRTEPLIADFDRPLNERGQFQPLDIAKQLNALNVVVDKALVSPAKRTKETWLLLESELKNAPQPIFDRRLYNASREDFLDVLIDHADDSRHLLVIAHCPAVIEVTEYCTGQYHEFKTANLAILRSRHDELLKGLTGFGQFYFERMIEATN